jgi:hypothetical protein
MLGSVSKRNRRRLTVLIEALENRRLLTITVTPAAPVVIADPVSELALVGKRVSFTAAADGTPVPTVQWQRSEDGGAIYSNISGATSLTYTFTATPYTYNAALGQSVRMYRAVFSNTAGVTDSAAADLTLSPLAVPILVTSQPIQQTVPTGQDATFTATSNRPSTDVQWQVSADEGTFTDILGANSPTYSFPTTTADDGNEYRAVFTNSTNSAASEPAKLTVTSTTTGIIITENPLSQTAAPGQNVIFTSNANISATSVQWQVSSDGGVNYSDIPNVTGFNYSFLTTASQNGDLFRAVYTNELGSIPTAPATLTVTTALTPPTATIIAPNVTSAGGNGETITVVYNVATPTINTSAIAPSNITVVGPNNQVLPASVFNTSVNGNSATVTYTITPPNGTWRPSDDGTYSVTVNTGAVEDANGVPNVASTASFTVQADTILVVGLTASPTPGTNGQSESFTATLTNVGPSGPTPTGSVTFFSNGVAIGTAPLASNGTATLVAPTLTTDAITAVYNGDATHPAASSGLPLLVPAPTPLAVTPSLTGALPGLVITGVASPIVQTLAITNVSGSLFHGPLNIKLYLSSGTTVNSSSVLLRNTTRRFRLKNQNFKTSQLKVPGLPVSVPAGTYYFVVVLQGADGRTSTAHSTETVVVA